MNRSIFDEDFKINVEVTPDDINIESEGEDAKELEEFARCILGDNFSFFSEFDDDISVEDEEEEEDEEDDSAVDRIKNLVNDEVGEDEEEISEGCRGAKRTGCKGKGCSDKSLAQRVLEVLCKDGSCDGTCKKHTNSDKLDEDKFASPAETKARIKSLYNEEDWTDLWESVPERGLISEDDDSDFVGYEVPKIGIDEPLAECGKISKDDMLVEKKLDPYELYSDVENELLKTAYSKRKIEAPRAKRYSDEAVLPGANIPGTDESALRVYALDPAGLDFAKEVANFFNVNYVEGSKKDAARSKILRGKMDVLGNETGEDKANTDDTVYYIDIDWTKTK